jgi:hypothetical protein
MLNMRRVSRSPRHSRAPCQRTVPPGCDETERVVAPVTFRPEQEANRSQRPGLSEEVLSAIGPGDCWSPDVAATISGIVARLSSYQFVARDVKRRATLSIDRLDLDQPVGALPADATVVVREAKDGGAAGSALWLAFNQCGLAAKYASPPLSPCYCCATCVA